MITQKALADELGAEYHPDPVLMPPTKLEAFHQQFPWAKQYATGPISQVYVSRVEPDLLNQENHIWLKVKTFCPGVLFDDEILANRQFPVELYLLDKDGRPLTIDGERVVYYQKYWWLPIEKARKEPCKIPSKVRDGTVSSTLEAFQQREKDVRFVLSYCERTKALITYKVPDGLSLLEWVDRQRILEREQFQKACSDIDAEANTSQQETEELPCKTQ